jgi:hypothetical protein
MMPVVAVSSADMTNGPPAKTGTRATGKFPQGSVSQPKVPTLEGLSDNPALARRSTADTALLCEGISGREAVEAGLDVNAATHGEAPYPQR